MFLVFLICIVPLCCCSWIEGRVDITARCMRTKCTAPKLNEELRSVARTDGLVKVLSWNVEGVNAETICRYLTELDLEVLGLQRVTPVQYYRLQSTCMKSYNTSGVPGHLRSSTATTFNAIFYKNDRKINTEIASGTYSSLTWTRLTFQSLQTTRHRRSILGQSLLAILNGQRAQKKYARAIRRKNYRKQVFFVNVDLKDSDVNKKDTLNKLLSHLYYNVMGRRRYHVILFGTVGWEITERMLSSYMKRRRRGSDVYFSLFRRAMANSNYRMKNLVNQIWQTYTKSTSTFKSVLSAVVHTETRNQPTFSTFLV